ncbi:hypothetical protein H632_c1240p0, partial [Helicosporidium sp. ATCC 50920]
MATVPFNVHHRGNVLACKLPLSSTVMELGGLLATTFKVPSESIRLLLPGRGRLLVPVDRNGHQTLEDIGIHADVQVRMMASSASEVESVQASHEPDPDVFGSLKVWEAPNLSPPPSEAMSLLQQLASDPGVSRALRSRGWRVDVLSELPPPASPIRSAPGSTDA